MSRPPSRETCEPCSTSTSPTEPSDEDITYAVLIVSAVSFVPAPSAVLFLADTVRARSQIAKGLACSQLRSGREKISQATLGTYSHWSEEEDRELISLLWTGARGKDRVLSGRNAASCKKRLQRIHNHLDKRYTELHKHAPQLVALATCIMRDAAWFAEVSKVPPQQHDTDADDAAPAPVSATDTFGSHVGAYAHATCSYRRQTKPTHCMLSTHCMISSLH